MLGRLQHILEENGLYGFVTYQNRDEESVDYLLTLSTKLPDQFKNLDANWLDEVLVGYGKPMKEVEPPKRRKKVSNEY